MEETLKLKLRSRGYREEYAEAFLNDSIAFQIRTLRAQRRLSQSDLARITGMKQGAISRIEKSDYGSWTVSTLKKIARALDVPLFVRFGSWGQLLEAATHFTAADLSVPAFDEDPGFTEGERSTKGALVIGELSDVKLVAQVHTTSAPFVDFKIEPGRPAQREAISLILGSTNQAFGATVGAPVST